MSEPEPVSHHLSGTSDHQDKTEGPSIRRVLIVCPFSKPDAGGVESHLEKLSTTLAERGVGVTLVTYMPLNSDIPAPRHQVDGLIEVIRQPWFGKGWFRRLESHFFLNILYIFPGLFYRAWRVYRSRRDEFDVIHAHGFISAAIVNILAWLYPIRTVMSTHAIYDLKPNTVKGTIFHKVLKPYDAVLAVGEPSRQEIEDIGIPKHQLMVHPNWIDLHLFHPENRPQARENLGLPQEAFVVLFVGRMIGIKGELILLEAAKQIKADILFAFSGVGPEQHRIETAAKQDPRIRYLGRLSDAELKQAYRAADLFISPVLYEEGFATVYLEALASGTPVLTAQRGCLPYFLESPTATLLEQVTPETVAEALASFYKQRDDLIQLRKASRRYAEEHFSVRNADIIYNNYIP